MARQGETAALDTQLRHLVDAFVADLTVVVRQDARDALHEALGREEAPRRAQRRSPVSRKPRRRRTRVIELVPAAPPEQPLRLDDTQLRDAGVEHLVAHPDLSAADLAALDAEPRHVERALSALVVEERVVASGKGRGMQYRVVGEGRVVELVPVRPPKAEPVVAEEFASDVPAASAPGDPARPDVAKLGDAATEGAS